MGISNHIRKIRPMNLCNTPRNDSTSSPESYKKRDSQQGDTGHTLTFIRLSTSTSNKFQTVPGASAQLHASAGCDPLTWIAVYPDPGNLKSTLSLNNAEPRICSASWTSIASGSSFAFWYHQASELGDWFVTSILSNHLQRLFAYLSALCSLSS
jgi:hypothetical protein